MNVVDLPIDQLREAPWNPNEMDQGMMARLRESLRRFGVVENLIVRPAANGHFEVIGGITDSGSSWKQVTPLSPVWWSNWTMLGPVCWPRL